MGEKPSVNFLIQAGMVSLGKRFKNSRGRRFSSQEVVAAINPFIILRASLLLAEMPGRLSCAGRRETTQRVGTQRARDRPDTGSKDRRFPCAEQVSHETIYRSLFIQARGVLKKELLEHLRARRTVRRSRHASMKRNGLGQIKNAVSISERPPSIEDRAVPGHWEGDLIGGSRNSYIATLVERHSRYVMLVKVANKDTESVVSALIKQSQRLPGELYRSLTWDRGKELADHQRLTLATEVEIFL